MTASSSCPTHDVSNTVQRYRNIAFWALLPITGLQGLLLRRRATKLPSPPGEVTGACGQGRSIYLLAAGDSIIAGIGASSQEQALPAQFARSLSALFQRRVVWRSDGKTGANLENLLIRLESLDVTVQADVILLSIGVNDVTGLSSIGKWRRQLELLTELIRSKWPGALVVFAGLPPMNQFPLPPQPLRFSLGLRARTLDGVAARFVNGQSGMLHVPTRIQAEHPGFCADGFHPSGESYAHWGEELARCVLQTRQREIHTPIERERLF